MHRKVRSVLHGPFPRSARKTTPPPGFVWVMLTNLNYTYERSPGVHVCGALPYLKTVPQIRTPTYWDWKAEIDAMEDLEVQKTADASWKLPADPFWTKYPTLARFCTDFWWTKPVKKPRKPCKLSIVFFSDMVNVSVNDEEKRRSMHTTAPTIAEALELIEDHLAAGNAPWRPWGDPKRK